MNGSTSTSSPTPTPTPTVVEVTVCDNYINGEYIPSSTNEYLDVLNPTNSSIIGKVAISNSKDVNHAVQIAKNAFHDESSSGNNGWSKRYTIKQRAACMMKLHSLIEKKFIKISSINCIREW